MAKKIFCLCSDSQNSAINWIRLKGPLSYAGFDVIYSQDHNDVNLQDADFILIQRDSLRDIDLLFQILKISRERRIPIIYETDDLLLSLPQNHPLMKSGHFRSALIPMLIAISRADLVTTSTKPIADQLRLFNERTLVLQNYLNDNIWRMQPVKEKEGEDKRLTIGFIGGSTHKADVESILEPLLLIAKHHRKDVQFLFWGIHPPRKLSHRAYVVVDPIIEDYQHYADEFRKKDIDILIAPLVDNPFTRAKSHIKFLEYSTLGVPAIFSKVRPYEEVIWHGKNGFLATSTEDWFVCLKTLIESPETRYRLAAAAQETVKKKYLLSDHADEWRNAYNSISIEHKSSDNETLDKKDEILKQILLDRCS